MNATVEIKDDNGAIIGKVIWQADIAVFIGDKDKIKSILESVLKTKTHPEQGWGKDRLTRMHD